MYHNVKQYAFLLKDVPLFNNENSCSGYQYYLASRSGGKCIPCKYDANIHTVVYEN